MNYIDLTGDDEIDLTDKDIQMEEANLVDLTDKDCEMNEADSATEFVIGSESVRFVPFVNEAEVPVDFIPICPTPYQSSSCDKVIMEKSKQRFLDNLTILKAFSMFDYPNLFPYKEEPVNCSDLEFEIFSSGKIYFLCKLLKLISQRKELTVVRLLIFTLEEKVEKLLFKIVRNHLGYNCVRLSRISNMDIYAQDRQRQGVTGLAITIAHREVPIKIKLTEYIFNFDAALTPPLTKKIIDQMGAFIDEPSILYLGNIGTSELRFKEYLSRTRAYHTNCLENLVLHANTQMCQLFIDRNIQFTPLESLTWNDRIAEQVVEWIFNGNTGEFYFVYPTISRQQDPLLQEEL